MADIREQIQTAAPQVAELDMEALRARADQVRTAEQRRTRTVFAGVAVGLCLLLAGVVVTADGRTAGEEVAVGQDATGPQTAADGIRGPSLQGGELGIADYAGEPLILFAWADWCGWCVEEGLPMLAASADELGVRVVGLAVDADGPRALDLLATAGVDLPTILISQQQLSDLVPGSTGGAVPVWFALNAEHEIVDTFVGPMPHVSRLHTLADRASTRTDPDPAVTYDPEAAPPEDDIVTEPTVPPSPPTDPDCTPADRFYMVQPGDTLSSIADAFYGDPTLFGPIAEANGITGDAPLRGRTLRIPGCEAPPGSTAPSTPIAPLDPDLQQALDDTLPDGWGHRPTTVRDGLAYGGSDGGVVIRQLPVAEGTTPEAMIQEAIDQGAGQVDLPDGVIAAFTNPAATGHMLVPIPGDRLIEISGEGDLATTLDYEIGNTLRPWMAAVRAALA